VSEPAASVTGPVAGAGLVGPLPAIARRPLLFLIPILALLVPALAYVALTPTTYTAEARVFLAALNVPERSVLGIRVATVQLASTYSRALETDAVLARVAERTTVPVPELRHRLSASPIIDTSVVRVEATGHSPGEAEALADAATAALGEYAVAWAHEGVAVRVEAEHAEAAAELRRAVASRDRLQLALDGLEDPPDEAVLALQRAQARLAAARLRIEEAATAARDNAVPVRPTAQITEVAPAAVTGDDRRSSLELAVVASLVLGSAVGAAAATWAVNEQVLRSRLRGATAPLPSAGT
jgi:hypothetical protein